MSQKLSKYIIFSLFAILTLSFVLSTGSKVVEAQTQKAVSNPYAVSLSIKNLKLDKSEYKAGDTVTGNFELMNDGNASLPELTYTVILGGDLDKYGKPNKEFGADSSKEKITLVGGQSKIINFEYKLPVSVPENFLGITILINNAGAPTSWKSVSFLYIKPEKIFWFTPIESYMENSVGKESPNFGIRIDKKANLSFKYSTNDKKVVDAYAAIKIYDFNDLTKIIKQGLFDVKKTKNKNEYQVGVDLNQAFALKNGIYFGTITIVKANQTDDALSMSNTFRFIVGQENPTFKMVSPRYSSVTLNEKLDILVSVDYSMRDIQRGEVYSLKGYRVDATIKDESGKVVGDIKKVLGQNDSTDIILSFEIKSRFDKLSIDAKIYNDKGREVDTYSGDLAVNFRSPNWYERSSAWAIVVIVILLIAGITIWLRYYRKKRLSNISTQNGYVKNNLILLIAILCLIVSYALSYNSAQAQLVVCGSANEAILSEAPSGDSLCNYGVPTAVRTDDNGNGYYWECYYSGANFSCSAQSGQPGQSAVPTCGNANNGIFSGMPSEANLCSAGTSNNFAIDYYFRYMRWNCENPDQTPASCFANYSESAPTDPLPPPTDPGDPTGLPACGSSNLTTVSVPPTENLCSAGSSSDVRFNLVKFDWSCANGANTVSCYANYDASITNNDPNTPAPQYTNPYPDRIHIDNAYWFQWDFLHGFVHDYDSNSGLEFNSYMQPNIYFDTISTDNKVCIDEVYPISGSISGSRGCNNRDFYLWLQVGNPAMGQAGGDDPHWEAVWSWTIPMRKNEGDYLNIKNSEGYWARVANWSWVLKGHVPLNQIYIARGGTSDNNHSYINNLFAFGGFTGKNVKFMSDKFEEVVTNGVATKDKGDMFLTKDPIRTLYYFGRIDGQIVLRDCVDVPEEPDVPPVCGSANGTMVSSAPSSGLCSGGISSGVVDNTNTYSWTCTGNGGTDSVSCTAIKNTANVSGQCNSSVVNSCTLGTLNEVPDTNYYFNWQCVGPDGTASCSKLICPNGEHSCTSTGQCSVDNYCDPDPEIIDDGIEDITIEDIELNPQYITNSAEQCKATWVVNKSYDDSNPSTMPVCFADNTQVQGTQSGATNRYVFPFNYEIGGMPIDSGKTQLKCYDLGPDIGESNGDVFLSSKGLGNYKIYSKQATVLSCKRNPNFIEY